MADSKNPGTHSENPFPGLRPFDVAESHLFFGREHQVDELLRKLELYHFLSVVGTSGSGKSSLVRAGLLAKLYNGYNIGESSDWLVAVMRPGANPNLNLAKALFSDKVFGGGNDLQAKIDDAAVILNDSPLGLIQIVRSNIKRGANILILVDQFEELFRFASENDVEAQKHAAHFVQLLIEAVRQRDAGIFVVMTLRADFLGDCAAFEGLPEAINDGQYLIPRLNREHYKLVIEGPVNYARGKIAPRLVQQLLNDMSNNQDQLPILQHVLMRTWENRMETTNPGDPMDLVHYQAVGTMANALNQHADEAFEELDEKQQKLAALIFKCITVKGSDNRGIRRPTKLKDICNITKAKEREVIETLEVFRKNERGFIMPPAGVVLLPEMMVDISHESLMRNWKRLEEWVDEEYDSAQMYQRLSEGALLYRNGVAGLWRDPELSVALEWKQKNEPHEAWAKQYNDDFAKSMRFLDESVGAKQRMLAEKKRRSVITNTIIVIFLLCAGGLTLWAMFEQNIAFKSAKEAIAQKSKAEKAEKNAVANAADAEKNYEIGEQQRKMAEEQTKKAEKQKREAERQRKLANMQTLQTLIQRNKAQQAEVVAKKAQISAESEKKDALIQKAKADSLRHIASVSEQQANQQRLYTLAKNLAYKSLNSDDKNLKALLALEAYKLNITNKSDSFNSDILTALYEANKSYSNKDKYTLEGHVGLVKGLAVSTDGRYLASAGDGGKVILWDLHDSAVPKPKVVASEDNEFNSVAFSQNNNLLAACTDQYVYVWKLDNLGQKPIKLLGHSGKITSLVFLGDELVSAGLDKEIVFNNLSTNKVRIDTLDEPIISLAYSKAKDLIAAGCENGEIYLIHNIGDDQSPELLINASGSEVTSLSFNDMGTVFAAAYSDGSLNIDYTEHPEDPLANKLSGHQSFLVRALMGNKSALSAVSFGKGDLLASAGLDGKVKLWLWRSNYPPIVFSEHDSWVTSMAILPDGKKVYSGGKDKKIVIYDIDEEDIVNRLRKRVTRNFKPFEWKDFMGDIPYQKVVDSLQ